MTFINHLINFLVKRSHERYHLPIKILATLLGGTAFVIGIPALILWIGTFSNACQILPDSSAHIVSFVLFIIGIPWMLSAVLWQLIRGKGTPVPVVPTKHFLQNGPYRYVRNPMMLGFFLYLFGWAFLSNTYPALIIAVIITCILLLEIKFIEEPELKKRFGTAYTEYKKETPFLFPKWKRK